MHASLVRLTIAATFVVAAIQPAVAQGTASCDKACLRSTLDQFVGAMLAHDPARAPLGAGFRYTENAVDVRPGEGVWKTATALGKVQRRYTDPVSGQAAYYGLIEENAVAAIVSLRVKVVDRKVQEAELVIARKGEGLFNPDGVIADPPPDTPVAAASKSTRSEMIAAADSYFNGLQQHDGSVVRAHKGCIRVENGTKVTGRRPAGGRGGRGSAPPATSTSAAIEAAELVESDCAGGLERMTQIAAVVNRRYPVADEEAGVVMGAVVFQRPPGAKRADGSLWPRLLLTEFFTVENARIRGIYAAMSYLPDTNGTSGWRDEPAQAVQSTRPAEASFGPAAMQTVREAVQKQIEAGTIPGAVTLVARQGRIAFWEAQGVDPASKQPLQKETIFWMASMTKPLVSAAVLMMIEEGKVGLEDPVSKFIPEFASPARVRVLKPGSVAPTGRGAPPAPGAPKPEYDLVPAKRPITVKDLLTHTSGIQTIGVAKEELPPLQAGATTANYVPKFATVPLDFDPGTRWAYSNAAGFDILVRIVEVASGLPFDRFLKTRIFDPLGMAASGFGPRPGLEARTMAVAPTMLQNPCIAGTTYHCGSAGLWMSADDYFRFAQLLLDGGQSNGRRLLKPESVTLLAANHAGDLFPGSQGIAAPGAHIGLGVVVIKDSAAAKVAVPAGSFGWDGVGTRRFWVMPQANAVLVMLLPAGQGAAAHRAIEEAVMQALGK